MKTIQHPIGLLAGTMLLVSLTQSTQAADAVRLRLRFITATENSGSVPLDVVRTAGSTAVATVDYATVPFTATAGVDYQSASGQLTFQPGETNKTISVTLLDDPIQEGAESFTVKLTNPIGVALGTITNADVNIDDNEKPFLLDPTFDPGAGGDSTPDRVLPLPDGKVLVAAGFMTQYQGAARTGLARLNPDGSLDRTYDAQIGGGGVSRWSPSPDGKLVICGFFTSVAGQPRNGLARLNPDGSLDAGFDPGDWLAGGGSISTLLAQPDGKVVLCGFFTEIHGQPRTYVARLTADGSLDETFNAGAGPNASVIDAVLQSDGKIVVCGSFTNFSGVARSRVARLNADGSLDAGYAPVTNGRRIFSFQPFLIRRLALRPDGKLFIQGDGLEQVNGEARRGFALLNGDGSLDPTFVPRNINSLTVNGFTALQDGGVLVAAASLSTAANASYAFARFSPDGSFDTAYDTELGFNGVDAQVAADGKYIVAGFFSEIAGASRPGLARLFPDGAGRQGFNFVGSGAATNESAGSLLATIQRRGESSGSLSVNVPLSDGTGTSRRDYRPVAAPVTFGPLETRKAVAVRLVRDPAPEPDEHFTAGLASATPGVLFGRPSATLWILDDDRAGSVNPAFRFSVVGLPFQGLRVPQLVDATAVTPLPGGRFLAAVFASDAVSPFGFAGAVARFNADGSPDLSFPPYPLSTFTGPSQISPVYGRRHYLVNTGDRLVRLDSAGVEDPAFSVTTAPADPSDSAYISDVVVQPDQKIVIAGHFSTVNGAPRQNIARVQATGELDPGFDPGAGPDDTVIAVALQPDGKLVIGGWFFSIGTDTRLFLARLNADGSLDPSLDPMGSFTDPYGGVPTIQSINPRRDGRMLISGTFDSYQGSPRFGLVRIMPDGTLDTSFDIGGGFVSQSDPTVPGFVAGTVVQRDGKVLATGAYSAFNGTPAIGIVRLNANGSLDPGFQLTGTELPSANAWVGSPPVLLRDGGILIPAFGGSPIGFSLNGVVRLNGDPGEDEERDRPRR